MWEPIATPAAASARTSSQPATGSPSIQWALPPELGGGDEELRADIGRARRSGSTQSAIASSTVIAKRRRGSRGQLAAVEGEHRLARQRPEPEQAQRPQLAAEPARRDVDPLLARLQLAGEAVVDEDGVGARSAAATPPVARSRGPAQYARSAAARTSVASAGERPQRAASSRPGTRRSSRVRQGASDQEPSCNRVSSSGSTRASSTEDRPRSRQSASIAEQSGTTTGLPHAPGRRPPSAARQAPRAEPPLRQAFAGVRDRGFVTGDGADERRPGAPHAAQRDDRLEACAAEPGEPRAGGGHRADEGRCPRSRKGAR